jgi:hypothetical protein
VRLYDNPGGLPILLRGVGGDRDPAAVVNLRYRPEAAKNRS